MPWKTTRPAAPTISRGFFMKPEVRVLIGTEYLWGSLDMTSYSYTNRSIPVGLANGKFFDIGAITNLEPVLTKTWEAVETSNLPKGTIYDLIDEECTVTINVVEVKPQLVDLLLATTGLVQDNQYLWSMGGGCASITRPVCIEWTNVNCDAPTSESMSVGISGGMLTIFDAVCTSGLNFGSLNRAQMTNIAVTLTGRPVMSLPVGKRTASLWLY